MLNVVASTVHRSSFMFCLSKEFFTFIYLMSQYNFWTAERTLCVGLYSPMEFLNSSRNQNICTMSIEKGVMLNPIFGHHIVCPFMDLWSNVDHECTQGPTAKNSDFCNQMVHEEQWHCATRLDGFVANALWVEAKGFVPQSMCRKAIGEMPDEVIIAMDEVVIAIGRGVIEGFCG
jgi:hypothetical protein